MQINTIATTLQKWYGESKRDLPFRATTDPYKIWISEVMLQQTQIKTVIPYYNKWIETFPNIQIVANSKLDILLKIWEGLGYYARARNLKRAAEIVVFEMEGCIPNNYRQFRQLPGVGDYIAAAVQSIAFGKPLAAVDGNVKRVLARLYCRSEPTNIAKFNKIFQDLADRLLVTSQPGTYNQALMELGAMVCRPKSPTCLVCPVQNFCDAHQKLEVGLFPVRQAKKKRPEQQLVSGIFINCKNEVLVVQRPLKGLLGGLWEFPNQHVNPSANLVQDCKELAVDLFNIQEVSLSPTHLTQIKHAYTHFQVVVDAFFCYLSTELSLDALDFKNWTSAQWKTIEELDQLALTGITNKLIPILKKSPHLTSWAKT